MAISKFVSILFFMPSKKCRDVMIFVIEISATHYKPLLKKMRTPPVDNDMIGSAKDFLSLPPSPDLMGVRTFDIFLGNHNFVFIVLKQPSILNVFLAWPSAKT